MALIPLKRGRELVRSPECSAQRARAASVLEMQTSKETIQSGYYQLYLGQKHDLCAGSLSNG
jgi:hypothetical protein